MAYYIPASQLRPTSAINLDVQIVKQAIQRLSTTNSLTETEENLHSVIESRLGRKFKTSLIPFLKSYPNNFDIETDGKITFVSGLTRLELCPTHCSGRGTCRGAPICDKLHICKFYLLSNSCQIAKTGRLCKFGHDLTTQHNKNLLQEHCLDELNLEELRNLFRSVKSRCAITKPLLCKFYNVGKGCTKEGSLHQKCTCLHLCRFYISGTCKFGKNCKRSHDLLNPQVKELLERYGISTRRSPKEVLADLQECGVAMVEGSDSGSVQSASPRKTTSRFQMKRFNSNPNLVRGMENLTLGGDIDLSDPPSQTNSAEICIFDLRGKCGFGDNCRRHHKNSMYQWQFRQLGNTQVDDDWTDFRTSANFELELNFSEVEKEDCYIEFDRQHILHIDFEKMIGHMKDTSALEIRRISTESSAVQKFQPLATQWKWYWKDQRDNWVIYGETNVTGYKAMLDSESLEQNYQENPTGQMKFATMGHEYIMDFCTMKQKNIVHKTERCARRRPVLVQPAEVERRKKKSADTGNTKTTPTSMIVPAPLDNNPLSYIPKYWSFDRQRSPDSISDHLNLSPCSYQEYKKLKKLFFETMPTSANIVKIERIENGELWMNFVSKREKMKRKRKGDDITELQLFHGTNERFIKPICKQGFDFRFSGSKTGNKYGKGSYFAKYAKTADSYTDSGVKKHMFVVRVLPGDFAPGSSSFVRPPPKNPQDPFELYDSCVDNLQNPNIYVIFTFDQVFPEYIIEYQKLGI